MSEKLQKVLARAGHRPPPAVKLKRKSKLAASASMAKSPPSATVWRSSPV
jgi:hypothetical protein